MSRHVFRRISLLRLSEKGFERRSECGFGRYIGAQTCPIVAASVPLGATFVARSGLFRQFHGEVGKWGSPASSGL